ncbi:WD40 repeat-like protein [Punctularia strigosozonata HHB-11173 SS5]|uniref:WD40 repeat-like protein n=1 Tax=Punctularia strigosozonata (strain HHB-11173) TaxID=741275 RepID=UPI00044168E7|nr:WD40 repeat-like protein [Punctularia strigosozonata HHB-11173 SS5]EIN14469.1 WD40 repeat-like protein [Punctularia strigosozonata HHB-11173 SS5]
MRVKTLEIRWHDSKPISTCDFQPAPFKKARPTQDRAFALQAYKLATGGEDNHVRLWLVHPHILPSSVADASSAMPPAPRQPRVEYLATLSRHSAAVNVVRFSPNGEYIASAGDDGMLIIWAPSSTPQTATYGSDLTPEEQQYEKEYWKARVTVRCTTMQVYDLAWSPTGEYIIAGSTDNCARVYSASDGKLLHEIAEHNHYVQGVAWDPLNEYIATQSSDRSMHIYSITSKDGRFEAHAVGKNTKMTRHHRTSSSHSRPRMQRRESTASDAESVVTSASERLKDEIAAPPLSTPSTSQTNDAPLTPSTSVASTPHTSAAMFPPPSSSSRRSSFSTPASPASSLHTGRSARSPSPMPALPAIRALPATMSSWATVKLYGDENFTNFFRRLTFSPDGGLLLTPAGQFEDPSVVPGTSRLSNGRSDDQPTRGRKGNLSINTDENIDSGQSSCVYVYSRANFARPPIAQLPGHKKATVAVRFSPILYELRPGVAASGPTEPKRIVVEKGKEEFVSVDLLGPVSGAPMLQDNNSLAPMSPQTATTNSFRSPIAAPAPVRPGSVGVHAPAMPSPALSATDSLRVPTPARSRASTPNPFSTPSTASSSVFALPYRMLFAVATKDTVTIHDTQQAGPISLLTKLHYDEFTDLTWSPDGQCLILSSRDGYCTLVVFDEILPAHHTQQHTLQLQSIAHHHSLPMTTSSSTPSSQLISTPTPIQSTGTKRSEPPLTPAASVDDNIVSSRADQIPDEGEKMQSNTEGPPKKKRRVALTRVGDIAP